jgi:acetoin utilization deacetylase AcuC-like enzyme
VTQVHWCPEYVFMGSETTEKSLWVAADLMVNPIGGVEIVDPYHSLDDHDVIDVAKAVHSEDYVDLAVGGVGLGVASAAADRDRLVTSILASSAGMVSGARAVANGEQRVISLSAGMHHASRRSSNGFCTFNGLAMAARELQECGVEKVLILDLDAHHGGGTEEILAERMSKVGHLDLATDPFDSYRSKRANTDMMLLPRGGSGTDGATSTPSSSCSASGPSTTAPPRS